MSAESCQTKRCSTWHGTQVHTAPRFPVYGESLFVKKDNLVFQLVFGKGISNYYNDNFGLGTDVGFAADGHLVATPTGSGQFGYTHNWTKVLRSTVSYGYLTDQQPGR